MTLPFGKTCFTAAVALLCIGAFSTIADAGVKSPQTQAVDVSEDSQRVSEWTATAKSAEAKINASPLAKRAMRRALTNAEIKTVLMQNGFTAKQLMGVKVSHVAAANASRVTITIKCCPLEIIVSW